MSKFGIKTIKLNLTNFLKYVKNKFNSFAIGYYKFNLLIADLAFYFAFGLLAAYLFFDNSVLSTTSIISFFAIILSLSSVVFSFARSIENSDIDKELVNRCAERMLHSAILLVYLLSINYTILQLKTSLPELAVDKYGNLLFKFLYGIDLFLFLTLLNVCRNGLFNVFKYLESRTFK